MARPQPLPRWAKAFGAGLVVLLVAWIAYGAWPKWSTVAVIEAFVDGERIGFNTNACGASDERVEMVETEEEVTITAEAYRVPRDQDCVGLAQPQFEVVLEQPLGDRLLVDGSDGTVLTCEEPDPARLIVCAR